MSDGIKRPNYSNRVSKSYGDRHLQPERKPPVLLDKMEQKRLKFAVLSDKEIDALLENEGD